MGLNTTEDSAQGCEGDRCLGPTLVEFLTTCWQWQPAKLGFMVISSSILFLVTFVMTFLHRRQLLCQPVSLRRQYYVRIACTPLILSGASILSILSPASTAFSAMVQKFYEAVTLDTFGMLIFTLLWHESQGLEATRGEEPGVERVAHALAQQGPKKHFRAPPLGCCWRSCMTEHNLSVHHLSAIFWMVRQYVVVTPTVGALAMVCVTAFSLRVLEKVMSVAKIILIVSNLVCLYGLFIVYLSSHDLLHHWNTSRKFVSIKVVLVLMAYQEFMAEKFGQRFLENRDSCFAHIDGWFREWPEVEVKCWSMWLLCLEMVPMAVALRFAFPAKELSEPVGEIHHSFLDMEMARKIERRDGKGKVNEDSADEAESGEETILESESEDA